MGDTISFFQHSAVLIEVNNTDLFWHKKLPQFFYITMQIG